MAERRSTQVRREEIKTAILRIIADRGFRALSTHALAESVGLSEGALFRHFPNKRAMILAIMDDVGRDMVVPLEAVAEGPGPAPERLQAFLCAHIRYLVEHRGITLLLVSEAAHLNDAELKKSLHGVLSRLKEAVRRLVRDGQAAGVWDSGVDPDRVSSLYMGIPVSLNIEMILSSYRFDVSRFCEDMGLLLSRTLRSMAAFSA
jgi:AcrR family transcriptional regulator